MGCTPSRAASAAPDPAAEADWVFLEASREAAVVVEPATARVRYLNGAAAALFDCAPSDVPHGLLSGILVAGDCKPLDLNAVLNSACDDAGPAVALRRDGGKMPVRLRCSRCRTRLAGELVVLTLEITHDFAPVPAPAPAPSVPAACSKSPPAEASGTNPTVLQEQFMHLIEAAPNGFVVVNGAGKILVVNAQMERMFGYTRAEMVGSQVEMLIPHRFRARHPDLRAGFMAHATSRAMGTGRDLYGLHHNGSEFCVEVGLSPAEFQGESVVVASIVDITMRKRTEERFHLVVESAPNGIIMVNRDGRIALVNAQAERIFGYDRAQMLGQPLEMLLPERLRESHARYRASYVAQPTKRSMGAGRDLHGRRADGSEFPIEIGLNPIQTPEGMVVLAAIVDITERKHLEEKLRLVIEASPNALVMVDEAGSIVLFNSQAELLFGLQRGDVVGKPFEELLSQQSRKQYIDLRNTYLQQAAAQPAERERELFARRKDGTDFPVEIVMKPVHTSTGVFVLASIVDLTERHRLESLFRRVVESAPSGILVVNAAGRITLANAHAEKLFGYSSHEMETLVIENLVPGRFRDRHPSYRAKYMETSTLRPMGAGRELFALRKDGSEFPVEVGLAPIDRADGHQVLVTIVDISERLKATELVMERDSARREALSRSNALSTMSHEIRTPLMGIIGGLELFDETSLTAEQRNLCDMMRVCSDSLLTIINDILDFSKLDAGRVELEHVVFDPRKLVDGTVSVFVPTMREKGLVFASIVDPSVPLTVAGDPNRLRQVLMNVLGNAVKFTPTGKVMLTMRATRVAEPDARVRLHIGVSDTGIGMSRETLARLFTPFSQADRSTTRIYGGTGLGLTICKRLVELMGGSIAAHSESGLGTDVVMEVDVTPPEHDEHPAAVAPEGSLSRDCGTPPGEPATVALPSSIPSPGPLRKAPRVLLVEDDLVTQRIAKAMLTKMNFEVLLAANGAQALDILGASDPLDVVLMDCEMPVMDGFQALAAIRARDLRSRRGPPLPVIAMTANALAGDRERCLQHGFDGYISKPFRKADLSVCLEVVCPELSTSVPSP